MTYFASQLLQFKHLRNMSPLWHQVLTSGEKGPRNQLKITDTNTPWHKLHCQMNESPNRLLCSPICIHSVSPYTWIAHLNILYSNLRAFSSLGFCPPNLHYADPSQTVNRCFFGTSHDTLYFFETSPADQREYPIFQAYWCYWPCTHVFSVASPADQCFSLAFLFGQCFSLVSLSCQCFSLGLQNHQCSSLNFQEHLCYFLSCAFEMAVSPSWRQISWDA